ncbi:MAG: sigma-54 dependent transcriptional regulator [Bacteroidales bacterium]|nr:sigma-54 dependent transcriptional regulator [Bacteroidales bacterium]
MHNMDLVQIKQRFDIIGDNPELNRALEIARQVAGTDLSVLVTGESGVGKEVIPQIIHQNSPRKHGVYIAVNCGAIPEGTIDSELFGHEKGSFTGALETRKGYFEEADGGTLFLDEVAELPLSTQVRLLRVLQTGEFLKVGSSKVQKTDVRVVAATNINLMHAIEMGRFREDLYYRLNTVPIMMPPLRDRKEDIYLLFRKFALDFADKYMMPVIKLNPLAQEVLESYRWPGNVRQLKSVAEQISVLEHERLISAEVLKKYLPLDRADKLPVRTADAHANADYTGDRDIIFKILFQLRKDVDDLKAQMGEGEVQDDSSSQTSLVNPLLIKPEDIKEVDHFSIQEVNADLIKKALEKHGGKRKAAAEELGISERTLYRKIKELGID